VGLIQDECILTLKKRGILLLINFLLSLMLFLLVDQKQKGLFMTLFVMYQYKKGAKLIKNATKSLQLNDQKLL